MERRSVNLYAYYTIFVLLSTKSALIILQKMLL